MSGENVKFCHPAIIQIGVNELVPYKSNARTHSRRQIRQIAGSIQRFGFLNPVLIDGTKQIIAGHGRVEAAKSVGLKSVPCLCIDHLSHDEKRAYILADNRLAEKAGWDREVLAIELQHLVEIEFDTEIIGFETPEIDIIFDEAKEKGGRSDSPEDRLQLGSHRLLCGSALDLDAYPRLLEGGKADLVVTDPPFKVKIEGNVGGLGRIRHRDFAMASGEMSRQEFTSFLSLSGDRHRFKSG